MDDLIVFNESCGVIYQFSKYEKHPRSKDYVDRPSFYPTGRLDTDSEGLLLLTGNGVLQAQIADPGFKRERICWAQMEGSPNEEKLDLSCSRMDLSGLVTRPAKVRLLEVGEADILWPRNPPVRIRKTVPDFWLEI